MPGGFTFEEHTADLAIRGRGDTLAEAFAQTARGLARSMVDADVGEHLTEVIEVVEPDLERLLYRFLEEVRFLTEVEGVVFARFDVTLAPADGGWTLKALVHGEAYDASRHGHVHEIKAVTLHGIRVQDEPPEVYVVVDI